MSDAKFSADSPAGEAADPLCAMYPIDGGASVPFEAVQDIFNNSCISCHASHNVGSAGGTELDLEPATAWARLVGQAAPASEACGGIFVVPGNPDHSYLYQKLTEDRPCSGERMPRGDVALPLPDCLVALVRAWIAAGAAGPVVGPADGGGNDAVADWQDGERVAVGGSSCGRTLDGRDEQRTACQRPAAEGSRKLVRIASGEKAGRKIRVKSASGGSRLSSAATSGSATRSAWFAQGRSGILRGGRCRPGRASLIIEIDRR